MRRAQSTRHYARPSLALAADDLGVLREGDESNEDVLRRQLLDKDREVDRVRNHVIISGCPTNLTPRHSSSSRHKRFKINYRKDHPSNNFMIFNKSSRTSN